MRRAPALVPLSRHHHRGLAVSRELARAAPGTARAARAAFLAFWEPGGQEHLRLEEELLLPALARRPRRAHAEAVSRVRRDHAVLRGLAASVEATPEPPAALLCELGERLGEHIRHEERELFGLLEDALDASELERLAAAL